MHITRRTALLTRAALLPAQDTPPTDAGNRRQVLWEDRFLSPESRGISVTVNPRV